MSVLGRTRRRWALLAPFALALGCYGGLGGVGASGGDAGDGADGDGGDGGGPAGLCGAADTGPTRLTRLSRRQYDNTVRDLLGITAPSTGFTSDEKVGAFTSNSVAPVSELQVEQYQTAAETLAETYVAAGNTACDPIAVGEDTCARQFIEGIAPKIYRRPVSTTELDRLMAVYTTARETGDFDAGLRVTLAGMLQSPFFLYHIEFGLPDQTGDVVALDNFEVASRLSYFLWNSMPDDELFAAAEAGDLNTDEGLMAQFDRMLEDPKAQEAIGSFHLQWLAVDGLAAVDKDPGVYPQIDDAMLGAMEQETVDFVNYVLTEGDGRLETLLAADFSMVDGPLFDLYGITVPPGHTPGDPVPLPAGRRAGLLTQASMLTAHSHANQSSPVLRGVAIRQNVLCQPLPPPPPDVDNVAPDPDPNATTRERFAQHNADPACSACHSLIDDLGFALENFDGAGVWRDDEGPGLPVDASGEIRGTTDIDGAFNGPVEFAQRLSTSQQVRECFASQWFRYGFGRIEGEQDSCSTEHINEAFAAADYDVRALLRSIVQTDAFRFRRAAGGDS